MQIYVSLTIPSCLNLKYFSFSNINCTYYFSLPQVSAENLKNCTINVKYSPLTSFVEIVNCDGLHVYLAEGVSVSTVSKLSFLMSAVLPLFVNLD